MYEWIRVEDQLPEDNVKVLLYIPYDDSIRIGWHVHRIGQYSTEWAIITSMSSYQTSKRIPSHWCYLPEKPRRD